MEMEGLDSMDVGEVIILAHATSQLVNALSLSHYYSNNNNNNIVEKKTDKTFQVLFWIQKRAAQCFEVCRALPWWTELEVASR